MAARHRIATPRNVRDRNVMHSAIDADIDPTIGLDYVAGGGLGRVERARRIKRYDIGRIVRGGLEKRGIDRCRDGVGAP